mgnify:FL=1
MAIRPTDKNLFRYNALRVIACVMLVVLIGRLFFIQVIDHDKYEQRAIDQQTQELTIEAKRGSITDRNGNVLAVSATAYKIVMAPSVISDDDTREEIADGLSSALSMDRDKIYEMTLKKTQYVEVARRVEKQVADKVSEFISSDKDFSGIITIAEDPKRYYPNGNLLSTVLGFVGSDNQGLEGVEVMYDSYLKGSAGKLIAAKTSLGTSMPFEYEKEIDAKDGCTVELTVDMQMQSFLEKHMENARVEHNVQNRIAGVIMNVKTGEILAMSSKPDYDPNNPFVITDSMTLELLKQYNEGTDEYKQQYKDYATVYRQNKVLQQYEPGSTFKIFTASMALEEGLVSLTETFNCVGFLKISGITVKCHKTTGHGVENLKEGIANSCNPVFMTLGARIGQEKYYDYVTLFGLREKTNVGLPGEQSGYHFAKGTMAALNLANAAFGQSFKITPMQLIAGVSSVANDGQYMQPYIIKRIVDNDGNVVKENTPSVVRQTVSKQTSDILKEYLEYTVVKGKNAYLEGYRIAGKTGTSQKLDTRENGEDNDKRIASFICFAPADDPQLCVLVVVDEPNSEVQYGSYIAAPLGRDIMKDALDYMEVEPDYSLGSAAEVSVPNVVNETIAVATSTLAASTFQYKVVGDGDIVQYQIPSSDSLLPEGSSVLLYTDKTSIEENTVVPNLIGKTAAECNQLLINSDLNIKVVGDNISYSNTVADTQSIAEGQTVPKMTVITVTFKQKSESP